MGPPAARAQGVVKIYGAGETAVRALNGITAEFSSGVFTAIMGPSGSGKSTLLHCLAGLDNVTAGSVYLGDVELGSLNDKALTQLRRDKVGFIFQSYNLVPTLTAEENIRLPNSLAGREQDEKWLQRVIEILQLQDRLHHLPAELSGGQQQRVAAARALSSKPQVVFADEPTGNLDSRSGGELLGFLRRAVDEFGQTIVMVTHDAGAAGESDRVLFLTDGTVVDDLEQPTRRKIIDRLKKLET